MNNQLIRATFSLLTMFVLAACIMLLVEYDFVETWLALFFIMCVPAQVAAGELLAAGKPSQLLALPQPARGLAIAGFCGASAYLFVILSHQVLGGNQDPGPPLISYSIVVVVVTFWFAIVWRCWPLSTLSQSPYWRCLSILTVPFVLGYGIFHLLFNFRFLQSSPLYHASLDPGGLFTSWYVIAFLVTTVAILFSLVLFEFKLFRRYSDRAFLWGASNSLLILTIAAAIYYLAIGWLQLDPVVYLVNGPISYIFGVLIPLNLFKGELFSNVKQPRRGIYLVLVSTLSGIILNLLYHTFALNFGPDLAATAYGIELWLANAMLAFSFPILVALTDHFDFWPLGSKSTTKNVHSRP